MKKDILAESIDYLGDDVLKPYLEERLRISSRRHINLFTQGGANMNPKNTNKWFFAVLGLSAALICAVIAIIVICMNPRNVLDDPTVPPDGAETGIYYYDTAAGEVLLSFNSGNKFTLTGPELNKSGEYAIGGDTVSLDYVRDEDGITEGKLVGDTVVLTLNGATVTFLKKVNYTVSFDEKGGSEVPDASVLNGKTLQEPPVPTKDGFAFVGWYMDEAFTALYDFGATCVKADITLFARWVQTVIGQCEYTVDFDLCYAGGESFDPVSTVGGKLYHLPVPQREGYEFCGWFVSMYEDGEKLSYEYTENTILDANTTLFAVWAEADGEKLPSPTVSVTGSAIRWSAIHGASGYTVVITDSDGKELYNNREASTTKSFDFDSLPAGDYKIEVVATAPNTLKNSEPAVRYFKNKGLPRVSVFKVVDGVLIFNAVEGAEKYLITVDCGDDTHNHTLFDNGPSTSYNFINCKMQEGGIRITVTAMAAGAASSVSETFVYERSLSPVSGVVYDESRDAFVWTPVENAASYDVTLIVGGKTVTFTGTNQTSLSVSGYTGEMTVSVVPVTDGYYSPAAVSASYTKTAPVTPSGIRTMGMMLLWDAVEGATSYEVRIGTKTYTVTSNELDLSKENAGLSAGNSYSVSVKTVAGDQSSLFSEPVSIGYYLMSDSLRYSNKTVYWTPVLGVSNYEVRVNGGMPIPVTNSNFCAVALTKPGKNLIEVRYTDMSGSEWVGVEVYAFTVTYQSRSISSGEVSELVAIGDTLALPTDFINPGFDFAGWYNSPGGAAGNGKKFEGTVFTGNADTVFYADWSPKSYKIQLQIDGYNITNLTQGQEQEVTYTKDFTLPVPESSNEVYNTFIGWFAGPSGAGDRLTDEKGNSLMPYGYYRDITVFPFFDAGILAFVERSDGTYAAKAGQNFDSVSYVTVPYTYNGKPVSAILENAFSNRKNVVTINIPDTIELVGVGAFSGTSKLSDINVYAVEGNNRPKYYSSHDGALLRHDAGNVYLYAFPRAKTGTYEVPSDVDVILGKVFQYSSIEKVIIGNGVSKINEDAFYKCEKLAAVEFRGERQDALTLENEIFYSCNNIVTIKLPAKINAFDLRLLQALPNLQSIEVEDGGSVYGSVNGMLTNSTKKTILYCPKTVTGEFTVPRGIQHIGEHALEGCSRITSVVIPNYVKSIGDSAFSNCKSIKTVTIDGKRNNDLEIGSYAFAYCDNLATVTFGGSGTATVQSGAIRIGSSAFVPSQEQTKLRYVVFEEGTNVSSIGDFAFAGQTELYNLSFAEHLLVRTIGASAFSGCTALTSIHIPASTTSIGASAFQGCSNVVTVTFTEGGEAVAFGGGAFANCAKIKTVYLPKTVKTFHSGVFSGCPALTGVVVAEGNPYFTSENGVLYDNNKTTILFYPKALDADPETLAKLPWDTITTIDDSVFRNNPKITSFVIPKGVSVIGANAFYECVNLTSVSYEQGGTSLSIGVGAFGYCSSLTDVRLPAYTSEIAAGLFEGCNLTAFDIPASVTSIGNYAFAFNANLASITIPAAVSNIGSGAFYDCAGLREFNVVKDGALFALGGSGDGVFSGCSSLTSLDLKNRATIIGDGAFSGSGITSVVIGSNVTSIGAGAFKNSLVSQIFIPATVHIIGSEAFASKNITNIVFELGGDTPLSIMSGAFKNSSITTLKLPARVMQLYDMTYDSLDNGFKFPDISMQFENCSKLESIHVEDGGSHFASIDGVLYETDDNGVPVTLLFCPANNVGKLDKHGNATYEVIIPKTVTLVVNRAFKYVTKIKTVTFEEFDKKDKNYGKQLLDIGCGNIVQSTKNANQVFGSSSGTSIVNIYFPSHLRQIGTYAISNGKNATPLNITFNPDARNVVIGRYAFYSTKLHSLTLPSISEIAPNAFTGLGTANAQGVYVDFSFGEGSTLTNIPSSAFSNTRISELVLPASVQMISASAFASNNNIANVSFAEDSKLVSIGNRSFSGCAQLATFDLSNVSDLQSLGANAFEGCKALTSFAFPESLLGIGRACFKGTSALETIYIPKSFAPAILFSGEDSVLANMPGLVNIVVDPENKDFAISDGVLYDKAKTIVYCFPAGLSAEGYTLPNTVRFIENGAFYGFTGTKLILPEGLETIGDSAFYESALTELAIPASVTFIGDSAFCKSAALKTVTYARNAKLNSIGKNAFASCGALEYAILPDGVEAIGAGAFEHCTKLAEVLLPAALTEIPDTAFRNCSSLSKVTIQQNITAIGASAFEGSAIESIEIPASVTAIGNFAFYLTEHLTSVVFTEGSRLESLGEYVFFQSASLQSVQLPQTVTSMGQGVFQNCVSLTSVTLSDQLTSVPASTFEGCVNLVSANIPLSAAEIGEKAFYQNKKLITAMIPATVANIGTSAFEGCEAMTTLVFEEGSLLTALGTSESGHDNVFKGTGSLGSVRLPEGLTFIGAHVFEGSGIKDFSIPAGVTSIGDYAFANCDNVSSVEIFANVLYLGDYAFFDCDALESATVSFGLEYFGALAFGGCEKLSGDGYIPATVIKLGANPYAGSGIHRILLDADSESFQINDKGMLLDISGQVLYCYPASIQDEIAVIPESVNSVVSGAFAGASMKSIVFPAKFGEVAPYLFMNCDQLETVIIEAGITSIGEYAFADCDSLLRVTIPNTATTAVIGAAGNDHTPTTVGSYAFAGCNSLTTVVFEETAKESPYVLGTHLFENCTSMTEMALPNYSYLSAEDRETLGVTDYGSEESKYGNIPSYMFAGSGIVSAVIPENYTFLETNGVFMNCKALASLTFQAETLNGMSIGNYYFYGCSAIKELDIPQGILSPFDGSEGYQFAYCTSLERFTLRYFPDYFGFSSGYQGGHTFEGCVNLRQFQYLKAVENTDGNGEGAAYTYVERYLKYVGPYFFAGCTSLKRFTVANGAQIAEHAFDGCTALSEFIVDELVEDEDRPPFIPIFPFSRSVTADGSENSPVTLDEEASAVYLKSLGSYAFRDCTALKTFTLVSIKESVGEAVFDGWLASQTVTIDHTIDGEDQLSTDELIGFGVFKGCRAKILGEDGTVIRIDPETGNQAP